MSTFDDDERSVAHSRPIDLYVIATPTQTYRLTSHVVDVTYQGNVYTATTMSRGNQTIAQDLTGREMVVYLPISHPVVQRFAAFGIPEREIVITAHRLQERSGIAVRFASGFGQSLSIDGRVAMIRVPSTTDDAFKIKLPTVAAQRLCNHVLYDAQCQLDRAAFSATYQILAVSGTTITTSSPETDDTFYVFGDIRHAGTGEIRMVVAQSGNVLTLNLPFVQALIGEPVVMAPGCAHDVLTCRDKFANVVNFGGMPEMNGAINPWAPGGLGVIRQ